VAVTSIEYSPIKWSVTVITRERKKLTPRGKVQGKIREEKTGFPVGQPTKSSPPQPIMTSSITAYRRILLSQDGKPGRSICFRSPVFWLRLHGGKFSLSSRNFRPIWLWRQPFYRRFFRRRQRSKLAGKILKI
jgi:hypothetical protein